MSLVKIRQGWSPAVRYAARAYRRELKSAQRRFEKRIQKGTTEGEAMSSLCAEEAQAVISLLRRLGYGGGKLKGRARDRIELELMVHELDVEVSLNFFRAYLAQAKDLDLHEVFSRRGRERMREKADGIRRRHIEELRASILTRERVREWLGLYFGPLERGRKYREFARVQFDEALDEATKLSYISLLITQIANRSGRPREEILAEYEAIAMAVVGEPEVGKLPDDIPPSEPPSEGPQGEKGPAPDAGERPEGPSKGGDRGPP